MKVAIASSGEDENALVSERAGRAPFYLVFEDGELKEKISNPFAVGGGGAGFAIAKMLADKKVKLVIAGNFGLNMENALKERGLKFEEKQGAVKDAVKEHLEKSKKAKSKGKRK